MRERAVGPSPFFELYDPNTGIGILSPLFRFPRGDYVPSDYRCTHLPPRIPVAALSEETG